MSWKYLLKRLLLIPPTLLGITFATFLILQVAPGGPIEQKLRQLRFGPQQATTSAVSASSRGRALVSDEVLAALKEQYGFDKPLLQRYWIWLTRLAHFDFGKSFVYGRPAMDVILSRFPVSLQFGVASFILTYLISVPVGLVMARYRHRSLDRSFRFGLLALSSVPSFVVALILLLFFAGGSYFDIFPIAYLYSENYAELGFWGKLADRAWHFILPLTSYIVGSFTGLAFLQRNSILGEIEKDYVRTARSVGISEKKIFLKHAFRNALIPVVTGIGGFLGIFLAGSLLIETIFQLNGIGALGYEAVLSRDYNIIMGLTVLQSLALLIGNIVGDIIYVVVDPRISYGGSPEMAMKGAS